MVGFNVPRITFYLRGTKLHNCTLLPATVNVMETFLEVILWKSFQFFRRILNDVSSITKALYVHCSVQSREQAKINWSQAWGMLQYCHIVFCSEILDKNQPVCWSIVVKEKRSALHFSGAFPSDRMPKTTKVVEVHFFSWCSNSCK